MEYHGDGMNLMQELMLVDPQFGASDTEELAEASIHLALTGSVMMRYYSHLIYSSQNSQMSEVLSMMNFCVWRWNTTR